VFPQRRPHIRVREILPLEQKRFSEFLGQGVGKAVAEVQAGGVAAALAEIPMSFPRDAGLGFGDRFWPIADNGM
jgi:hypothetical protein